MSYILCYQFKSLSVCIFLCLKLAESWMGYTGPGYDILSLVVTDRFIWCLDFKGVLFCSSLLNGSLSWQRFEENVHQVAVSPSGKGLFVLFVIKSAYTQTYIS